MADTRPGHADGAAIRRARIRAGMKPKELATRAGLSTAHLRNVENGYNQASLEKLHVIARELGVPVTDILSDSGRAELAKVGAA